MDPRMGQEWGNLSSHLLNPCGGERHSSVTTQYYTVNLTPNFVLYGLIWGLMFDTVHISALERGYSKLSMHSKQKIQTQTHTYTQDSSSLNSKYKHMQMTNYSNGLFQNKKRRMVSSC